MNPPEVRQITAPDDLTLAFQLAGVGLCISRERIIQRCNLSFAEMFGYTPEDLQGRTMECLYPSYEEFQHTGARGMPVMQKTGAYSDERIMMRKDGSLFWCHVIGRALDRGNPFACAVWSFEDISVQRPVTVRPTAREREVAQLMIQGKSSKEIAKMMAVSPRTIEAHRGRLLSKFEVKNAAELSAKILGFSL